jgi:hypothetical protein
MRGELSRIFALVSVGFLVVIYGVVEVCSWLLGRISRSAGNRSEASDLDLVGGSDHGSRDVPNAVGLRH